MLQIDVETLGGQEKGGPGPRPGDILDICNRDTSLVKELVRRPEHPAAHVLHAGVDPDNSAVVLQR